MKRRKSGAGQGSCRQETHRIKAELPKVPSHSELATPRAFGWWWESHGFLEDNMECSSSAEAGMGPAATKLKGQRGENHPDGEKSWKKLSSLPGSPSPLTARGISTQPINLLHFGGSDTQP